MYTRRKSKPLKYWLLLICCIYFIYLSDTYINEERFTKKLVYYVCYQWFVHVATPVYGNETFYAVMSHVRNTIVQELFSNVPTARNTMSKINYGQLKMIRLLASPISYAKISKVHCSCKISFESLSFNMLDQVYPGLVSETIYKFLRKKKFKMYTDMDIWDTLNDVAQERNVYKSVSEIYDLQRVTDSWADITSVPLVTVQRSGDGYDRLNVVVTQEPFIYKFALKSAFNRTLNSQTPLVPVVISLWKNFFHNNQLLGWLSNGTFEFETLEDSIILINRDRLAPVIINYDPRNWRRLAGMFDILPMDVQVQLLVDSLTLAKVGIVDYDVFLNMSAKMPFDTDYLELWKYYSLLATNLADWFHGSTREIYINEFLKQQLSCLYSKIVDQRLFDTESKSVLKTITEIKDRSECLLNRSSCYTPEEYDNLMYEAKTGSRLTGEHNIEIMRNLTLSDWEVVANGLFHALPKFRPCERTYALHLLSFTEHETAFETYMNFLLLNFNKTSIIVTENEQLYVIENMDNRNLRMLMNFVNKNFHLLKERLSKETWKTLIEGIVRSTRTKQHLEKLSAFYETYSTQFDSAEKIIENGLKTVTVQIQSESIAFVWLELKMDELIREFRRAFLLSWDKVPLNAM